MTPLISPSAFALLIRRASISAYGGHRISLPETTFCLKVGTNMIIDFDPHTFPSGHTLYPPPPFRGETFHA